MFFTIFRELWGRWLTLAVCLAIMIAPTGGFAAAAQDEANGVPAWATTIDKTVNVSDEYNGVIKASEGAVQGVDIALEKSSALEKMADIPANDDLSATDRLITKLEAHKEIVKRADQALDLLEAAKAGWKIGKHLGKGEYKAASQELAKFLIDLALKYGIKYAVTAICGALTMGAGAIFCYIAASTVATYFGDKISTAAGDWIGAEIYCRFRPRDRDCKKDSGSGVAAAGPNPGGGTGPNTTVVQIGTTTATSNGRPAQGGRSRAGGTSVGSSSINVSAANITTSASGGADASTTIGTITSGSGRANVAIGNVDTEANGRSATTRIAPNGGNVTVTGPIVNHGGDLTVGGNGMYSRDGRPCLDIYQALCMVQIYPKPAHHPCMPTYLYKPVTNMCELPSDYDHKIMTPGF